MVEWCIAYGGRFLLKTVETNRDRFPFCGIFIMKGCGVTDGIVINIWLCPSIDVSCEQP